MGDSLDDELRTAERVLERKRRAGWTGLVLTAAGLATPSLAEKLNYQLPQNYELVQWGAYLAGAALIGWGLSHTLLPDIWKRLYGREVQQMDAKEKSFNALLSILRRDFRERDERKVYQEYWNQAQESLKELEDAYSCKDVPLKEVRALESRLMRFYVGLKQDERGILEGRCGESHFITTALRLIADERVNLHVVEDTEKKYFDSALGKEVFCRKAIPVGDGTLTLNDIYPSAAIHYAISLEGADSAAAYTFHQETEEIIDLALSDYAQHTDDTERAEAALSLVERTPPVFLKEHFYLAKGKRGITVFDRVLELIEAAPLRGVPGFSPDLNIIGS